MSILFVDFKRMYYICAINEDCAAWVKCAQIKFLRQ